MDHDYHLGHRPVTKAHDGELAWWVNTMREPGPKKIVGPDLQVFERDGKEWVRFNLDHISDGNDKNTEIVEAPVVRWVKIRQSTTEQAERRPVIEAWVNLGQLHEKTQFTLADRSHMTYPVLLGRDFFKDIALVDVGKKYVQGMNEQKIQKTKI